MNYDTELLVIGGGPAGYTAAIRASQLGVDVTLVERDAYGGTCLNTGCIPSKALISAADLAQEAGDAADRGIDAEPTVDYPTLSNWKSNIVDRFTKSVEKLCKANNISLIEGDAKLQTHHTASLHQTADGGSTPDSISFQYAAIATGSRPVSIPGFSYDHDYIWNSSHALTSPYSPDKLVIVGAGYIGMELATMYSKTGTDVTVVEALDDALPAYESDVTRIVKDQIQDLGVELVFAEKAVSWNETTSGERAELVTKSQDGQSTYQCDQILIAVGREPVSDTVNIDTVGIERDDQGFIQTNDNLQTACDNIFAVGDVAGEPMLAHKASHDGVRVAKRVAGEEPPPGASAVPTVVFTDPEIASVGYTQADAESNGYNTRTGEIQMRSNGRALSMGQTDGFVRVVAKQDGEVIGGTVVGPEASELISEIALAIEVDATVEQIAATIHPHPTLAEATKEAAENAMDKAIHSLNR